MAEVWGVVTAGVLAAGATVYASNNASKTASNAAGQAAYQPVDMTGPSGAVQAIRDPTTGVLTYVNNGSQIAQNTQGPLTTGANNGLTTANALQRDASQGNLSALGPGLTTALGGANSAFSDVNNPGAFFDANGASIFNGLGNVTAGNAGAANNGATTALNGGGTVGTANTLGTSAAGAAGSALSALQNFDPNAYAANAKAQLDALAAPGDVDATQSLFNQLQSSGRLGITQNGQLGDLGGLSLAQSTANNQRSLQAAQLGLQQQQNLVSNANTLGTTAGNALGLGANLTTNAVTNSTNANATAQNADVFGLNQLLNANNLSQNNALQRFSLASTALGLNNNQVNQNQNFGLNNINASLQENSGDINAQNSAVNAAAVRSGAASNAGAIAVAGANNTANNVGSLFSGLAPTVGKALGSLTTPSTTTTPSSVPASSAPATTGIPGYTGTEADYPTGGG